MDSSAFYYDAGGGSTGSIGAYPPMTLHSDGTWVSGSSTGTWSVQNITQADWASWNVSAYGPTLKIVVSGWNGGTAEGPIEASSPGTVDFYWIVYHVGPPSVPDPGSIWLKFGHE